VSVHDLFLYPRPLDVRLKLRSRNQLDVI
jgi:hypothetical protein